MADRIFFNEEIKINAAVGSKKCSTFSAHWSYSSALQNARREG
jgi:hypothetical protein